MGHYRRICGRERPNEQFSGKGHKIHVCKRCKVRPKSEHQAIEGKDDIFAFLEQSHISEKNVAHLERMAKSGNPQVASLAAIVLDVARIKPYKTRRLKFLAHKYPELLGSSLKLNACVNAPRNSRPRQLRRRDRPALGKTPLAGAWSPCRPRRGARGRYCFDDLISSRGL